MMLDLHTKTIDLDLFKSVIREIKNSDRTDIIDSFDNNQFQSKEVLLKCVNKLDVLDKDSEIIIFGCWYGSILIPALVDSCKRITGIDLDDAAIKIAKNKFFRNNKKVEFITGDVFSQDLSRYHTTSLFINTSCEHMAPMKEWPWWTQVQSGTGFAFQSNNMYDIKGHTNCVDSIEEFKQQMPDNFQVVLENELEDERGIRFTLAGYIL